MAKVALTRIEHGKKDGELVVVEEGDKVPSGLFSKDELEVLEASGSVGDEAQLPPDDDEVAELRARVAELEAKLQAGQDPNAAANADAAAKAATEPVKAPAKPAGK